MMATLQGNGLCEVVCAAPAGCVNSLVPVCVRLSAVHPSTCPTKAWRRIVCTGSVMTMSLEGDNAGVTSGTPLPGLYNDYDQLAMNDCRCAGGATSAAVTPTVTGREVTTACNNAGKTILLQYDTTTVPPTELSRWNLFTNAAEPAGALVKCAGASPTLVSDIVCSGGTAELERVRVFDSNNVLTGTTFYNQAGTVVPTPVAFTLGACAAAVLAPYTTTTRAILRNVVTGSGTIASGMASIKFVNVGTTAATVAGAALAAGETLNLSAYEDPVTRTFNRLPAIPYIATGTAPLSITTQA